MKKNIVITHRSSLTALSAEEISIFAVAMNDHYKICYNLNFSIVHEKHHLMQQTEIKCLPDAGKSCIIRIYNTVKKQNSQIKMHNTIIIVAPVNHHYM